jgi:glucan phosphoethanolaminetransferase (alkaline phosphatase superfamily)
VRDERRRRAAIRRWAARALVLVPGALVVGSDLLLRHGPPLHGVPGATLAYAESATLGLLLWGSLLVTATARRGAPRWAARFLLGVLASLAAGAQLYAFGRYHAFLSTTSMLVGTSMLPSLRQELWFDRASFLRAVVPPIAIVALVAFAQRRLAAPRWRARRMAWMIALAVLCLVALDVPHVGDAEVAPFDVLYIHGMGQLVRAASERHPRIVRANPGPRSPLPVPKLTADPARPRNVLMILTESVRATSACVAYDPGCTLTPFSNAAAKGRIPFTQMRTVDSTTAISLGVLWAGIDPMSSRAALHAAPLVWEYANAAGVDTAYWTSQNLLFSNSGTWLGGVAFGHHVNGTELDPDAPLTTGADDGKLVSYVTDRLGSLREPFLAVVHLSNTHQPYGIDERDAPLSPHASDTGSEHRLDLANRYADSIYHQDRAVGRLLDALRARPEGARTVVVFLSDHGEQLYEHGILGHTATLYEPEIRIPMWIDAPAGTLSDGEEGELRRLSGTPLTTLDVLPTLLDLVGVLDDPAMQPFTSTFVGRSLLRGGSPPDRPVVLTNCSELWTCAFKNWGAMAGTRKVLANQGDRGWHCFDVQADPEELRDLGPAACDDLSGLAERALHGRPF